MSELDSEELAAAEGGEAGLAAWRAELAERQQRLRSDARALMRATEGWGHVKTQEQWEAIKAKAQEDYRKGGFLIERLGSERYLDPELLAVLLTLRRGLVDDLGVTGHAELMLVDMAVLSYYYALRAQGWIGNLATVFEREWFGLESPTAKLKKDYGYGAVEGLNVEGIAQDMQMSLWPLFDRANRMLIRNLRALKELHQAPTPSVQIGSAGQVNVAAVQSNTTSKDGR
jgi:hypothetical protein